MFGSEDNLHEIIAEKDLQIQRLQDRIKFLEDVRESAENYVDARVSGNEDCYGELMWDALKAERSGDE